MNLEFIIITKKQESTMKITAIEQSTKKPLSNTSLQLNIRTKDNASGPHALSVKTDQNGNITLDEKYKGSQITTLSNGKQSGPWVTANEGVTLTVSGGSAGMGQKEKH
jgi:hypothetical protein